MFYDELRVGQSASFTKTVAEADLERFTELTGDLNPIHMDPAASPFGERIVHGMLTASLLCTVYGMQLPGAGAIQLDQRLRFKAPVRVGDTVTAHVEVIELCERNRVRVRSWCVRQDDIVVVEGEALLLAAARPPGT